MGIGSIFDANRDEGNIRENAPKTYNMTEQFLLQVLAMSFRTSRKEQLHCTPRRI
jgi:hypothetical protein